MTLPFSINGARAVIPGVYDYFRVQDSLPSPAPGNQSILIIGEADSGVPSNLLDLRLNYFTDYNSLLAYYKSGNIVDAARQIFANQPSPAFVGQVSRVYVYKTNATTPASKVIASPVGFGSIVSAVWEESGNLIKSQIKTSASEVKPTKTFQYIPTAAAKTVNVVVSGKKFTSGVLAALATPTALVSALSSALTGVASVTGGAVRTTIADALGSIAVSVTADVASLTISGGVSTFLSVQAGDVMTISTVSAIAGAAAANAGVYIVQSSSANAIVAQKIHSYGSGTLPLVTTDDIDVDYVAPVAVSSTAVVVGDILVYSPVVISATETTVTGSGASIELLESSGTEVGALSMMASASWASIISTPVATSGRISASVSSGSLVVSITGGNFSMVPKIGDVAVIGGASVIVGATLKNAGVYMVTAASPNSLTLLPVMGSSIEAVSSVLMAGGTMPLVIQPGFVTTSIAAQKIVSSAERSVIVMASRQRDNAVWPSAAVGGAVMFEISYSDGTATAAKLSISPERIMTITFTGGSLSPVVIPMLKYETLSALADYIGSLPGFAARIEKKNGSLSVSVLDMVFELPILSGSLVPALNGRIKGDYNAWLQHFNNNKSNLLAFSAGSMTLKAGLPANEASAGFLSGAAIGATTGASILAGLDAALKITVSQVVPLFSRDSTYDIADGYTDAGSTYQIDAINLAVKAHVATASGDLVKRRRFGLTSFHGSFADAKLAAQEMAYERVEMAFELAKGINSQGNVKVFLPWMLACSIAAGRAQSAPGTSMLRKSFNISDVKHIGNESPFSDTLVSDFDPESNPQVTEALEAGLLTFANKNGVQLISADLSTRSRDNDPQGWVWERVNVLFCVDVFRDTLESVLDNYIGPRTTDVTVNTITKATSDVIESFVNQGFLISGSVVEVKLNGNQFAVKVLITPPEAVEAIVVDITAARSISA